MPEAIERALAKRELRPDTKRYETGKRSRRVFGPRARNKRRTWYKVSYNVWPWMVTVTRKQKHWSVELGCSF